MDTFEAIREAGLVAFYPDLKISVTSSTKAWETARQRMTDSAMTKQDFLRRIAEKTDKPFDNSMFVRMQSVGIVAVKLGGCECHGKVVHICCAQDLRDIFQPINVTRLFNMAREYHFEHVPDDHGRDPNVKPEPKVTTWTRPSKQIN